MGASQLKNHIYRSYDADFGSYKTRRLTGPLEDEELYVVKALRKTQVALSDILRKQAPKDSKLFPDGSDKRFLLLRDAIPQMQIDIESLIEKIEKGEGLNGQANSQN